jgi:hypothetical protein
MAADVPNDRMIAPLTGLERELLTYVERLTLATEASAAQFAALERRSTGQINDRLDALESCANSLLRSQVTLTTAFSKFSNSLDASSTLQQDFSAAARAIRPAVLPTGST